MALERLGAYTLHETLGQGGMGTVYRATHHTTGQEVALKTVSVANARFFQQLQREMDALSKLKLPGVVQIIDHGVTQGRPWYAMELIKGIPLRAYCPKIGERTAGTEELKRARALHGPREQVELTPTANAPERRHKPKDAHPALLRELSLDEDEGPTQRGVLDEPALDFFHLDDDEEVTQRGTFQEPPQPVSYHPSYFSPFSSVAAPPQEPPSAADDDGDTHTAVLRPFFSHTVINPMSLSSQQRLQQGLLVVQRLCQTLSFLHGEGIVHCDLKPDNILLDGDGWPVLIDFGVLSRFAGSGRERLDIITRGLGTILYMAPEQCSGALFDARADLYALGCVLYELATGRPPFVGRPAEIIMQHQSATPVPLSIASSLHIPPALELLVSQLLAKRPEERIGYADRVYYKLAEITGDVAASMASMMPGLSMPQEEWRDTNSVGKRRPLPAEDVHTSNPLEKQDLNPRLYLYRPGFAGRDALLRSIDRLFQEPPFSSEVIWLFAGESGMGKTRLVLEVAQQALSANMEVVVGECTHRLSMPLAAFQPLFESVWARAQEGKAEGFDMLPKGLGREALFLAHYAPFLQKLPPFQTLPPLEQLPAEQLAATICHAMRQLLRVFAARRPLLILLDDLQWADRLTIEVLDFLSQQPPLPGVTLMGTYRSEEQTKALRRLESRRGVACVPLEQLDEEAVGSIVLDMLALPEVPKVFVKELTQLSEGNPYFVSDFLWAAVEEGLLWRDTKGYWQWGEADALFQHISIQDERLPGSLQALIQRRLKGLPPDARLLLFAAAVLGHELSFEMLQAITEFPESRLWSAISELSRRQILDEFSPGALRFAHSKLRDTTIERLSKELGQIYHRRAAQAIERRYRDLLAPHWVALSRHWKGADEPQQAQEYARKAARQAFLQRAYQEAIKLFQEVLALEQEPDAKGIEARHQLGQSLQLVGRPQEAEPLLRESLALAQALSLPLLEAKSHHMLAALYWQRGQLRLGEQASQAALALYQGLDDRAAQAAAMETAAGHALYLGHFAQAQALCEKALSVHQKSRDTRASSRTLSRLADVLLERGLAPKAIQRYKRALVQLEEHDAPHLRCRLLHQLAHAHTLLDDLSEAQRLYEEVLRLCEEVGEQVTLAVSLGNYARNLFQLGQLEQAQLYLRRALSLHKASDNRIFGALHELSLLALRRLMGEPLSVLEEVLAKAEDRLEEVGSPLFKGIAICERGHQGLAKGVSAQDCLQQVQEALGQLALPADAPTDLCLALQQLARAQESFVQKRSLFRGECLTTLPPMLLQSLVEQGLVSSHKSS